jgi:hypothetical protein
MRILSLTLIGIIGFSCVAQADEKPQVRRVPAAVLTPAKKVQTTDVRKKSSKTVLRTLVAPPGAKQPIEKNIDEEAAHNVNAFCLSEAGEILAACGDGPGEIRIFTSEGKFVRAFEVSVKPESINNGKNGTILVAGNGKLFQFSDKGAVLQEAESPHVAAIRANADQIRVQVETQIKSRGKIYERQIELYEKQIEMLKAAAAKRAAANTKDVKKDANKRLKIELNNSLDSKATKEIVERVRTAKKPARIKDADEAKDADETEELQLTAAEKARIGAFETTIKRFREYADRYSADKVTPEQIDKQVEASITYKKRVASISSDGDAVYIATGAATGYGFEVWKIDNSFKNPEKVVSGLSGCCGQMDVQACANGLYVAENSRHRVVCYDNKGKELRQWGKRDRTGVAGFTSCCNPMNVTFGKNGDVYTAESNTGRIKRFTADGEFVDFIGDVKLVPGCKNVSIAVSKDGKRVFMLDITRNHVVVMDRKSQKSKGAAPSAE